METRHDQQANDLRRRSRRPCDGRVKVQWLDLHGQDKFFHAKALDICELGLRLETPEPLPAQTYLMLRASELGLLGHASVRYCTRLRGSKFAVGVEFTAGLQWAPKE